MKKEKYHLKINKEMNSEETKQKYIDAIDSAKIMNNTKKAEFSFNQHFVGNPFFEVVGNTDDKFDVKFYDGDKLIHSSSLGCNMWTKLSRKYFTEWVTKVYKNGDIVYDEKLNLNNRRVYITMESKSIGDSIAWVPYLEEFRKKHNCIVIASTFWNKLFKESYKNIEFVEPGTTVNNLYAMYSVGYFYNMDMEPELPNTLPLQKTVTNILGLEYKEIKPTIDFIPKDNTHKSKYVTIAPHSTAGLKYWNNETGWQEVVDFLIEDGYSVINVSREGCDIKGVTSIYDFSMENIMDTIYHSEFFIGLSSGLSWVAWSLGKHVVMISNFTNSDHEFSLNCTRITNTSVCNGCWNNSNFKFDKGDWNWCPIYKGTPRQFECHKEITGEMVINSIVKIKNYKTNVSLNNIKNKIINDKGKKLTIK